MKLTITVKPRSQVQSVTPIDDTHLIIRVHAAPEDGKANDAIIALLADYYDISPSTIAIMSGHRARTKIIEIDELDEDL